MANTHTDNQNVLKTLTDLGLRVFPLPRGKRVPAIREFYDFATTDPDFSLGMNNAGVATGDGFAVLDIDVKDGRDGRPALEALGPLPLTLTVATPSGGLHLYFALPPGAEIGNSVNRLGKGIDVRGHHGYVVAPGSSTPKGSYTILRTVDRLPLLPEHVVRKCKAPRERDAEGAPAIELDLPENIVAAAHWLEHVAEVATSGSGGNDATFRVASRVKDFGVSEQGAREIMGDYWNEKKAEPSWDLDDLHRIIANAYSYGTSAPGAKAPQAEFSEALTPEQLAAIEATRLAHQRPKHEHQPDETPLPGLAAHMHPLEPFDPASGLRRRDFVLGRVAARKVISTLVSPPGIGKTTFETAICVAIACARPILGPHFAPVGGPKHVLLWCQEDEANELKLRLVAYMRHFGLTWDDFMDPLTGTLRLHILSGVERPLMVTVTGSDNRSLVASKDAVDVLEYIKAHDIAYAVFDPLAELHGGEENDNGHMGYVSRVFRKIAVAANCHVRLVHHTKKHDMASSDEIAGDMWSGRGAGAIMGVARYGATLFTVGEKCAKEYGIPKEHRQRYLRYDEAKNNLGPLSGHPLFFERVAVRIDEIDDEVGIVVPVEFKARETQEVRADVFAADMRFVIDRIMDRGIRCVRWAQVADALGADEYADGEADPGRYGLVGEEALRKRISRMFDSDTGIPISDELSGLVLRRKGREHLISREGVA